MSSFFETTEEDIKSKIFSFKRTYTFFIFYDIQNISQPNAQSILSNIDFKFRTDKHNITQQNRNQQDSRQVDIHFYNLSIQNDILHGISDVRNHSFENKAKLIINASEEKLGYLIQQFELMKVQLSNLPIMITSDQYQSDISAFLGWKQESQQSMATQNLPFYQEMSKQWIKASTERIDLWKATVKVSKQKGRILKVVNNKLFPLQHQDSKFLQQYFVSHLCIGYHAGLLINCRQKIKGNQQNISNSIIARIQKFKKFCCVGTKTMKATTGIANISLVDDKGEQLQILKQLLPLDSSEEETQIDLKSSKYKQYKDVLSILLTNINIYQNNPLQKSIEGKVSDGRLQLLTFGSEKGHRKICSAQNEVRIKLQAEIVDLQIGESIYRLQYPEQIKISFAKKIKVAINNQLLRC